VQPLLWPCANFRLVQWYIACACQCARAAARRARVDASKGEGGPGRIAFLCKQYYIVVSDYQTKWHSRQAALASTLAAARHASASPGQAGLRTGARAAWALGYPTAMPLAPTDRTGHAFGLYTTSTAANHQSPPAHGRSRCAIGDHSAALLGGGFQPGLSSASGNVTGKGFWRTPHSESDFLRVSDVSGLQARRLQESAAKGSQHTTGATGPGPWPSGPSHGGPHGGPLAPGIGSHGASGLVPPGKGSGGGAAGPGGAVVCPLSSESGLPEAFAAPPFGSPGLSAPSSTDGGS
jgi:hypothetical protein